MTAGIPDSTLSSDIQPSSFSHSSASANREKDHTDSEQLQPDLTVEKKDYFSHRPTRCKMTSDLGFLSVQPSRRTHPTSESGRTR